MKCENCPNEYDIVLFGSGRFCCRRCACSFATKEKRKEISQKVSEKLKGRKGNNGGGFKKGYDSRRKIFTDEDRKKSVIVVKQVHKTHIENMSFEKLSKNVKKRIILSEQNNKCLCGINEWQSKKLTLQLDHIDGNRNNELRNNLRILCPNCHSITETYAGKNSNKRTATDDELLNAVQSNKNIYQALKSLGMNNGRNYSRVQKLVLERGVEPLKTHF